MIRPADIFTFMSLFSGLLAFVLVLEQAYAWAGAFLLFAVLLDWLDGRVALHLNQQRRFGTYLDSLSDVCVFGFVPVAIAFVLLDRTLLLYVSAALFISAGAYRLARYCAAHAKKSFRGLPITLNGVVVGGVLLLQPSLLVWSWLYFLLMGILMVAPFRVGRL